jgi:hypothetical protein
MQKIKKIKSKLVKKSDTQKMWDYYLNDDGEIVDEDGLAPFVTAPKFKNIDEAEEWIHDSHIYGVRMRGYWGLPDGDSMKYKKKSNSNFPKCPECGSSTTSGGDGMFICSDMDCQKLFNEDSNLEFDEDSWNDWKGDSNTKNRNVWKNKKSNMKNIKKIKSELNKKNKEISWVNYVVWVGGVEVNDSYLTKDEANELADKYRDDGYDDVIVEEVDINDDEPSYGDNEIVEPLITQKQLFRNRGIRKKSISNEDIVLMFLEDSYPHSQEEAKQMGIKNFKTSYGSTNLKIVQLSDRWALVNYNTTLVLNDNGRFIFNTTKYSVSTSKIQNYIRRIAEQVGVTLEEKEGNGYGVHVLGMKNIKKIKSELK